MKFYERYPLELRMTGNWPFHQGQTGSSLYGSSGESHTHLKYHFKKNLMLFFIYINH